MNESSAHRFKLIYNANAASILTYALRRLADPADAAEVVAEVFTIAWRRMNDVPEGDAARLWLFGTARLVIQNERRRRRRTMALAQRLRTELLAKPPLTDGQRDDRVFAALQRLTPRRNGWTTTRSSPTGTATEPARARSPPPRQSPTPTGRESTR